MRGALAALVALAGCARERPPEREAAPEVAPAPTPAASCQLAPLPDRLPAAERVVAIGDLHGDLGAARAALRAGGLIDAQDRWSGGATVAVQTGDVTDRGDDEPEVLALLARLEREAAAVGGAFVALDGNHELMNAAGDFRYVTDDGIADYAHLSDGGGRVDQALAALPEGIRGRFAAFRPGGPVARELAARRVAVVVGDTAFAHAGLSAGQDLAALNRTSRCWLSGCAPTACAPGAPTGGDPLPAALTDPEGPLWTRAYGGDPPDCARLETALAAHGVARMIVGHTVQAGINAACDGKLWRIDVGLARGYGGPIEVLELRGGTATVLRGTR